MFHQVTKHHKVAAPRFSTHFLVFGYPDETIFLMFNIIIPWAATANLHLLADNPFIAIFTTPF